MLTMQFFFFFFVKKHLFICLKSTFPWIRFVKFLILVCLASVIIK